MSALLACQLDQLIKQIAVLVHQAPDPPGVARWAITELAGRTGLRVVVLGHWAATSERLRVAGDEVLEALRVGLAQHDARLTEDASWELVNNLTQELTAYAMSGADGGCEVDLEQAWGTMVER
jgi:hypothetical protein